MTTARVQRSCGALACALVLAACGGDDDADSGADGSTSTASTGATVSATTGTTAGTTATTTTSASSSATEDSGTVDTGSSSGTATSASTGDTSSETGTTTGAGFATCTPDTACPDGLECRLSKCCDGVGFCAAPDAPKCGGFVGEPCPAGGSVCVIDSCVADGSGECLDPADAAALEAEQPGCWNIG